MLTKFIQKTFIFSSTDSTISNFAGHHQNIPCYYIIYISQTESLENFQNKSCSHNLERSLTFCDVSCRYLGRARWARYVFWGRCRCGKYCPLRLFAYIYIIIPAVCWYSHCVCPGQVRNKNYIRPGLHWFYDRRRSSLVLSAVIRVFDLSRTAQMMSAARIPIYIIKISHQAIVLSDLFATSILY